MALVEEMSVADKLRALYDLQSIDSKIDEIRVIKGELPIEVKDLEDEIEGLTTRLKNIEDGIKSLELEIVKHRNNVKDCETLIGKYEKQQDTVKNNREFEALAKEIELQGLEIQLSEKKQRDAKKRIEEREISLDTTRKKLDIRQKECANKRVELERIIRETEAEEAEIAERSVIAQEKIEERLLKAYQKTRANYRNGLAVVKVSRNSCGGCFSKVPAQLQVEIATRKKITVCENCGRILVDENIDNDHEEEFTED